MSGAGSPSASRGRGSGRVSPVLSAVIPARPVWFCPVVPRGDALVVSRAPRPHRGPGIPRGLQRWREPGLHVSPCSSTVAGRGASQTYLGCAENCPFGNPGAGLASERGLGRTHGARGRGPRRPVPSLPAPFDYTPILPSPQAKPFGEILRSIPAKAAAPSLFPLRSDLGYSRCPGSSRGGSTVPTPPTPTPAPAHPGRCGRRREGEVVPVRPPRPHHAGRERIRAPRGC